MIAPCGIICTDCSIYQAALDRQKAEELTRRWQEQGRKDARPEWFKCKGCHGDDELVWSEDCKIRECCKKDRKLENCSLCGQFPCDLILEFENDAYAHHKAAVARLRSMRDKA